LAINFFKHYFLLLVLLFTVILTARRSRGRKDLRVTTCKGDSSLRSTAVQDKFSDKMKAVFQLTIASGSYAGWACSRSQCDDIAKIYLGQSDAKGVGRARSLAQCCPQDDKVVSA
jgi:hypothetical protein